MLHVHNASGTNMINEYDTYRRTLSTRGTIRSGGTLLRKENKMLKVFSTEFHLACLFLCKRMPTGK